MSKISVYIADDHPLVLDGFKQALQEYEDLEIKGTFEDGLQLYSAMLKEPVDLVISDLEMPEMDGIELCINIRRQFPKTKVLIFTMYKEVHYQQRIIESGAHGCILKSSKGSEILEAIQTVIRGDRYYTHNNGQSIKGQKENLTKLTEREIDILKYIAQGKTAFEISEVLNISIHTVNTHRKNIQAKLDIHNTGQMVAYALKNKLIK